MSQSVKEILSILRKNEIKLTLDSGNLKVTSHKEKLPEAILEQLKANKPQLISYLQSIESTNVRAAQQIPAAAQMENYPLSSPQNAVWLASQLETSSIAYNIPQTYDIAGDVDIPNFEKAILNVIERHEILRTAFRKNEAGEIRQWILPMEELDFKISIHDFTKAANKGNAVRNFIDTDVQKTFNLEEAPAFRGSLLRLHDELYIFYCNMHHIISDEWSIKIVAEEVMTYYQALTEGAIVTLEQLPIQYKDYATWQQKELTSEQNLQSKNYWTERLSGTIPVINFPSKKARPLVKTFHGEKIVTNLGTALTANVRAFSIANGGSVFMSLLSGINAILQRYTSQKDIIIGVPVTGRNHPALERQIGFYVNLLPIRNQVEEKASFHQLFSAVKEATLTAFNHQQYPFESILKTTKQKRRDSSRSPLFDVLLDYHNNDNPVALLAPEEAGTIKELGKGLVKFDIEFHVTDLVDDLEIQMNFNTAIYEETLMHQFLKDLKKMFAALIETPNKAIGAIPLVEATEKQEETIREVVLPNFIEMFQTQVKKDPEAIAIATESTNISFAVLDELSNKLATALQQDYGIKANDFVGIFLDRSDTMLITMLGILKAGAAYIPIDTNYPTSRVQAILDDASPKLLVTETNYMFELPDFEGVIFAVDVEFDPNEFKNTNSASSTNENLAYILYTSGSTGKPKGVMISNKALANYLHWGKRYYTENQSYDGSFGLFTSISFDLTVTSLFLPLVSGQTLHILPNESNIGLTLKTYFSKEISCIKLTPAHINLLEGLDIESTHIKLVIVGGDRLHKYQVDITKRLFPLARIINEYGPTEATVGCSVYEATGEEETIFIGKPIQNTAIHIVNATGTIQPKGVAGELCIIGLGLANGYLNKENLTAEKFVKSTFGNHQRMYKTGDIARWSFENQLEYLGRNDEQVKIRGYRIELGEVNEIIATHPSIEVSEVLCRENTLGEKTLVAYIKTTQEVTAETIKSYLGKKLPAYTIPNMYIQLDEFPLTTNGKVDKEQLAKIDFEEANKTSYTAPETTLEKQLVALWEKHLQKEQIGITDNFFALGGDSIRAIQLVIEVKKILNSDLNVSDIFEKQTIQELVPVIENKKGSNTVEEYLRIGHQEIEKFAKGIEEENKRINIIKDDYEDIYPLTPIEVGMIFSSLIRNEEPVYYDQYSYTLAIENEAEFEKNIIRLTQRHASLRTKYYTKSFSQPTKVVYTNQPVPLNIEDVRMLTDEEKRVKILSYSEADLNIRLDFNDDLLWRIKAFRITDELYLLFFSFHHALLDGWSTSIFKTELSNITHTELAPLKSTYKDYCAITIGRKNTPGVEEFWKETLNGYTRNKLPFNTNRKKINDQTGMSIIARWMPAVLLEDITKLSKELKVSIKTICMAAHVYLLKVICAENEIVTGVVTHERPEIEDGFNIMGCFLGTVPFRLNVDECKDVTALITKVNDLLVTMKSKEIHLAEIAQIIGEKSTLDNPIFDTLMNYTDFHKLESWNEDSEVTQTRNELFDQIIPNHEMTNTLFDLEVDKTLNNLTVAIKYANTYFNKEDMEKAAELYEMILQSFVDNPAMPCKDIVLLTEDDKALIDTFNQTKQTYEADLKIHELFERKVAELPNAIALKQHGKTVDYQTLNVQANQLAHYLRAQGLKTGDHVGIIASRNFNMIVGLLGILKAGGVYIPIDPVYPVERKSYIIENSQVSWLLIDTAENDFDAGNTTKIFLTETAISNSEKTNLGITIDSNQLAYTIYTSGSTGRPKGVMIPHHAVINLVDWVNNTFNVNQNDILLFVTSMCFDLSVYDIFGMLAAGGSIVLVSQEEITNFAVLKDIIQKEKITFWDSVPTTMNYLVAELEYENANFIQEELRLVFMSGDWIPTQLPDKIKTFFPNANVISLGGATEGTVWSNYFPIEEVAPSWSSIPYGKPITNNFFYILDDHLNKVPVGASGELFIGGVGVAHGYANDAVKTKGSFMPDPFDKELGGMMYKTGDIGRMMSDGNMEFLGRKDYQVKIRGFRVELGEIESVVRKNEHVKEAIVNLHKNDADVQQLVVYIVKESPISFEEIRTYLRAYVPEYMIPEYCVFLDALPLNSNGKIDRKQLPKPDSSDTSFSQKASVAPETEIERQLSEILTSILNAEVSTDANFFELGIDSLTVGALVNRIVNTLEVNIGIRDVFNNPTITELATVIEKINLASTESTKESNNTEKNINMSFELYKKLRNLNVHIEAVQGKLNIEAPQGVLTSELVTEIKEHKEELLDFLKTYKRENVTSDNIPKATIKESYPMSSAQKRLWIMCQFQNGSIAYNMPTSIELANDIHIENFIKAIETVVDRHEILRTVFKRDASEEVRQWILSREALGFNVEFKDFTNEENSEKVVAAYLKEDAYKAFDLENGPLLRVRFLKLAENRYIFYYNMHHIISDGWSLDILSKEIMYSYEAFMSETKPTFEPLRIQYKDYSEWQLKQLETSTFEKSQEYWLHTLSGDLPTINLPSKKVRPAIKTFNGRRLGTYLPKEATQKLKQFCEAHDGSLFMGLVSSLNVLCYRYTMEKDVIIGVPTAGREHIDLENQIGFYVNTLPLRNQIDPSDSFADFFLKVKNNTLAAYEHQAYPFDMLIEKLNLTRDTSRSAVFDIMLALQNAGDRKDLISSEHIDEERITDLGESIVKFDINIAAEEIGDYVHLRVDYNEDVYDKDMMLNLLSHYKNIVHEITADANTPIKDIVFLSKTEIEEQLPVIERNSLKNIQEKTVLEIFSEQVQANPDGIAVVFEDKEISYQKLNKLSNQFARFLQQKYDVSKGDLVAINIERSEWMMIAILGILKCDAGYVPIDNEYPTARIQYIKEDSQCKMCIEANTIEIFIQLQAGFSTENLVTTNTSENTMYVIYTSGSTGNPKGVVIAQASLINYINWFAKDYHITAADSSMLVSSPSFDGVLTCVYGCLLTGGTLHIVSSQTVKDPFKMIHYIMEKGITFFKATPVYLRVLFDNEKASTLLNSNTLRLIITGGDKADTTYVKKIIDHSDIKIINHYGPTEATIGVSVYNITKENFSAFEKHLSIGSPIAHTSFYVLDENLALLPKGAIGELYIGGKNLAKGYLNKPDLSAASFIKNPLNVEGETTLYKTGDLVRWLPDHNIEFIGRKDNQVKIRGYRVELGEIEKAISAYEGVNGVVVICHKNQQHDNTLKAFIIPETGVEVKNIKKFLEQRVPSYLIPENFVELTSFPLTENGKIDRKQLANIEVKTSNHITTEYVAPTNDTQRRLIVLWEQILNKEQIGIQDDFFLLGGHSLSATRLITKIHKEFDVILGIEEIFLTPLLEDMALTISGKAKVAFKEIEVAATKPYYPLSSSHKRLYFLQQFDSDSTAYNMLVVRLLSGEVHAEKIENTIKKLINRHEILRTSFVEIEGEVMQQVHTEFDFQLDTHTVDGVAALEAYVQEYASPFDLSKAPLLRSSLVQLAADQYAWIVDLHHIISDGSSQQILINDFLKLYNEESLPTLRLQYKDFSEWQNNLFETGSIQNQIEYWKAEFAVPSEKLNLPTDFPRPQVFTFQGTNHIFTINKEDSDQLKALSLENGASLQMTLMTILFTLLHKYTQQEDIVIGCGINGRRHSDLDTIVGMFVNTICIRTFPAPDEDFLTFYKQVISKCILAYENQDLQFEDLVQLLNVQRETSGNPIFDVSMVLQNYDRRYAEEEELEAINMGTMNRLEKEHTSSKFDLTWFIYDSIDRITIEIEYYTSIFKEETIVRMADHFQNIIKTILKKPTVKINDIHLLSAHEIEKITDDFVDGKVNEAVKESAHIFQLIAQNSNQLQTAIAVADDHGSLTYEELHKQSNQLAQFLVHELQISKETRVGLLRSRTKDMTVDILGIMKAGGTYVPLDINSPEDRLVYILENSNVDILLTEKNLIEFANKLQWRVATIQYMVCVDTDEIYKESGRIENEYMDRELWEHVGETADDEIMAGGWMSSYTGEYISEKEMAEYGSNAYLKLEPILHENMKVLEIGCSSGLTMFPVAPKVKQYVGTDISKNILELTQKTVDENGHTNIVLERMAANEIDQLDHDDFDVIIINSVVQSFNGHNYLRDVLRKATQKMKTSGYIFLGDLMDEDRRKDLILDLENFKFNNENPAYITKLDWSNELFISKAFLEDLVHENLGVAGVTYSEKIGTIENELTKFRYDALLKIDQTFDASHVQRNKYQLDKNAINKYGDNAPQVEICASDLAYIIYTSGSTGKPKGVMIEHQSMVDLSIWQKGIFDFQVTKPFHKWAPLSFDASIGELVMALTNGCKLQMISNEDFLNLIAIINEKEN